MINICRFFKHKCFEKEYRETVEECEALKLENKELYRILTDLKEERKLKDKYKQESKQKHEIIEELIRERQELQKQLRHQLDMNIAMHKECEELKTEKEVIKKYLGISDKSIMQRLEELTEYKLKRQLKYIKIEEKCDRYRKALEEIEEYIYNNTDFDINDSIQSKTAGYDILQIIKDV